MEKRPLYAYENVIANVTKDTDPDLIVFATAAVHLAKLIKERGADVALMSNRLRLYSAVTRLRFLERKLAYYTEYGHLPVFPDITALTQMELNRLQHEYDNQFQTS